MEATDILTLRPLAAVLVSLLIVPVLLSSRTPNVREGWTLTAGLIKLILIGSMLPMVLDGVRPYVTLARVLPGVSLAFRVDALGLLFALVSSTLWIATSAYSIGYMRGLKEHGQTRYYCFFALAMSATIGVAFSANLLTLYLFYELLSFATYPLVTHHQDREARISGRKYLAFIVGGSIGLVLPAMIVCFLMTGTLDFAPQGFMDASPVSSQPGVMGVLFFMFVFGLAKAGVMPVHSWLPAAMVAPTPVSALLHAVAVVKVGAFSILRVTTGVFGVDLLNRLHLGTALGVVASVTIITASLIALNQDGLKRRLAFSTIGQLSYIVLGASLLTPHGLLGGMLHIAMHAFGKITLFFCAGAIQVSTGFKKVSQLAGLGRRMPWTLGAFLVGSLSVIGLPPGGGFLSKWFLLLGALESGQLVFLIVLLVSSFLNAAYFLPIVYRAFFEPPPRPYRTRNEGPRWCLGPILFTAGASVLLLLIPQPFIALARLAVRQVMGTG